MAKEMTAKEFAEFLLCESVDEAIDRGIRVTDDPEMDVLLHDAEVWRTGFDEAADRLRAHAEMVEI